MYLMRKCIFAKQSKASLFFAKQKTQHFSAFAVPLHFVGAEHFPLENVMLNIFQRKMYAKMHFGIKCIFAQLNIFLWKMYAKMHFAAF